MLCNINQKTQGLLKEIRADGCLFLCFAYVSPLTFQGVDGICALNIMWEKAVKLGYINKENEIVNHNGVADIFCLKVKYDDIHHKADEVIPDKVQFIFGCFVWKYGHFVVLDRAKDVVFDPLVISHSVKNGNLDTMRFYYAD